ncbi:DUF393 domain-containing protein [Alphaproteobacteria bacterium]|nr:DUF393 domain-containing protein [Alphaproteobacteria bacterium]
MIKVLYDGKCSICSKEISYYKKISASKTFVWLDIANFPENLKNMGISQKDALLFLHAIDQNSRVYIGIDAFILIWKNLRYWKVLAYIVSFPLIKPLAKYLYNKFAFYRFKRLDHCRIL